MLTINGKEHEADPLFVPVRLELRDHFMNAEGDHGRLLLVSAASLALSHPTVLGRPKVDQRRELRAGRIPVSSGLAPRDPDRRGDRRAPGFFRSADGGGLHQLFVRAGLQHLGDPLGCYRLARTDREALLVLLGFETFQARRQKPMSTPRNVVGDVAALQRFQVE
jgi:hypothetical protein